MKATKKAFFSSLAALHKTSHQPMASAGCECCAQKKNRSNGFFLGAFVVHRFKAGCK
jgi:hypothetical protein